MLSFPGYLLIRLTDDLQSKYEVFCFLKPYIDGKKLSSQNKNMFYSSIYSISDTISLRQISWIL